MTGYMEFLIWIGGMIAASVIIDRLAPMLPEGRLRDRLKNAGAVVLFGYVLMLLTVLMIADYYLGYSLGATMPEWYKSISFFGATRLPFLPWLINGIVMFGIAAFVFRLLGRKVGTQWSRKMFRQMPLTASFGLLMILIYAILSIFADFIAPYGQADIFDKVNLLPGGDPDLGGDPNHLLGTDQIGRDILSRLIYGAQNTVGHRFCHHLSGVLYRHNFWFPCGNAWWLV